MLPQKRYNINYISLSLFSMFFSLFCYFFFFVVNVVVVVVFSFFGLLLTSSSPSSSSLLSASPQRSSCGMLGICFALCSTHSSFLDLLISSPHLLVSFLFLSFFFGRTRKCTLFLSFLSLSFFFSIIKGRN